MPDLYIIRHGKSSWDNPHLEDPSRPLSARGERDAPMMANRLKLAGIKPDHIISSPALRARHTAELMSEVIEFPMKQIKFDWEVYDASTDGLLQIINRIESRFSMVFLYGHNPGLTYLTNALTGVTIDNIPTCGIAAIRFEHPWKKVKYRSGSLLMFDYPKNTTG